MPDLSQIEEIVSKIRYLINKRIVQRCLLRKQPSWNQLCSCLDVLEDTELGIGTYNTREFGKSSGALYLTVYGLLQMLFVQQDAVGNLCEALGIPYSIDSYPELKVIRRIRTTSVGHPTKTYRSGSQPASYHFISRPTLTSDGFELQSVDIYGNHQVKYISIPDIIKDQGTYLNQILTSIRDELENREKVHKEKVKMEKLALLFPQSLNYALCKVMETIGIHEESQLLAGAVCLEEIKQVLQSFKKALANRGIEPETSEWVKYEYERIEYALAELETYFKSMQNRQSPNMDEKAAFIFAFFLQKKAYELKYKRAKEIDEEYST